MLVLIGGIILLSLEFPILGLIALVIMAIIVGSSNSRPDKNREGIIEEESNKEKEIKTFRLDENENREEKEVIIDGEEDKDNFNELITLPLKSESGQGYYLFLDTETTGFAKNPGASTKNFDNWPYIVEIAWILTDEKGLLVNSKRYIIKQNTTIPREASKIHKITNTVMKREGVNPRIVYSELINDINKCNYIIGHNLRYDLPIVQCDLYRNNISLDLYSKNTFCTMMSGMNFTSESLGGKFPKLVELFGYLYFNNVDIEVTGAHSALIDTILTYRCFMEMIKRDPGIISEKYKVSKTKGDSYQEKEKLSGDVLKKDLTNANPESMFYDKKIVITGEFPIKRSELAEILKTKLGADIDTSIGKYTEFLLVGDDPGEKKLEKARNNGIKIINKDIVMSEVEKFNN